MKKVFFTFIMMALTTLSLLADNVDVNTAKSLGLKFLTYNTELKSNDLRLSYTATTTSGLPVFYVFSANEKGFVIVSADDRMRPILGYSENNAFNTESVNPSLNAFFQNYISTAEYVYQNGLERCDNARKDWESLKTSGKLSYNKTYGSVPPLVTTTWNQSDIYNSMCPVDPAGYGGHVKSGCVANAMAQIMNYWEWPQVGEGSHSYQSDYGVLEVNFGETNYQFELMPDFLDYTSFQAEVDAVALLQFHAGVSVEMMYGPTASGAWSAYVPLAMKYYLRYECDLYTTYLDNVEGGLPEWENMLRESIDRGEPLYYSAFGPDGGHAFVCSGYDENNLFHFNWGWQGFDNGYYAIDNFYLTYHDFPFGHEVLFNLRPIMQYYEQPKSVDNVMYETDDNNLVNTISFDVPTQKLNDDELQEIDSVIILRNYERLHTFNNPAPGETLSFEDQLDKNGVNYYIIYPMSDGLKGKAVIDTVMTGPTCEMTFNLYDSDNDGWLSPSLSILDSRGVLVKKIGLESGNEAIINVSVPDNDTITFFWNYVNAAYSDEDDECSFEILHDGALIYESDGKPQVGHLTDYYIDCQHDYIGESNADELGIYPNPAKEIIYITAKDVNLVSVYNSLGQIVMSEMINDNVLNVSSLAKGVYFVKMQDENSNVIVKKLIKN